MNLLQQRIKTVVLFLFFYTLNIATTTIIINIIIHTTTTNKDFTSYTQNIITIHHTVETKSLLIVSKGLDFQVSR